MYAAGRPGPIPANPVPVAVSWHVLTCASHDVVFATERGDETLAADPLLLRGVLMGRPGARPEPAAFYGRRERSKEFRRPLAWSAIPPSSTN